MKKLILIITVLILSLSTTYGQYSKWAVSGEYGIHTVNDKSAIVTDNFSHFGLGLRYNLNEGFSVGLTGGFDNIDVEDIYGFEHDVNYYRLNIEGYLNAFRMLNLKDDNFTVLLHGGPGVGRISTDNNYSQTVMNMRGGATLLYKLTNRFAITADYSVVGNFNQDMTLDGAYNNPPSGVTSNIGNLSVGLSYYFNFKKPKKATPKEDFIHGDWYYAPVAPTTIVNDIDTTIINNYNDTTLIINNIYNNSYTLDVKTREFVFFDHDSATIKETELNAIYKVFVILNEVDDYKLIIKGWASPTSSSDDYNLNLSARRSKVVEKKFLDLGVDENRIIYEYYGKDKKLAKENVHDAARRVELIVIHKSE